MSEVLALALVYERAGFTEDSLREAWQVLEAGGLGMDTGGVTEPFGAASLEAATQAVLGDGDSFFVQDGPQLVHFSPFPDGLLTLDGKLSGVAPEEATALWLALAAAGPVFFGRLASAAEVDAAHLDVRETPAGGRVTGWVGCSGWDLLDFLPGFYWTTLLGTRLAREVTGEPPEATSLPGLASGVRAWRLPGGPTPEDMAARRAAAFAAAEAALPGVVFDRDRAPRPAYPDGVARWLAEEGRA